VVNNKIAYRYINYKKKNKIQEPWAFYIFKTRINVEAKKTGGNSQINVQYTGDDKGGERAEDKLNIIYDGLLYHKPQ